MYYGDGFRMRAASDDAAVRRPYTDSNALFASLQTSPPQGGGSNSNSSTNNSISTNAGATVGGYVEGSTRVIAPPATPSPHFGFRRHATAIVTGGPTQPSLGGGGGGQTAPWQPTPREETAPHRTMNNAPQQQREEEEEEGGNTAMTTGSSSNSNTRRGSAHHGNPFRRYGLYDPQVELKDAVNYDTHARSLSPSKEGLREGTNMRTVGTAMSNASLYSSDEELPIRAWHGTSNAHVHEKEHAAGRHHTIIGGSSSASGLRNVYGIGPDTGNEGHSGAGRGAALALGDLRAALSPAQRGRWQESLRHKSDVQRAAQEKMMELMQYWLTLPTTRTRLEGLMRDTCSMAASTTTSSNTTTTATMMMKGAGSRSPSVTEHLMPAVSPRVPGKVMQAWAAVEKDDTTSSSGVTKVESAGERAERRGAMRPATRETTSTPAESPAAGAATTTAAAAEQTSAAATRKDARRDEAAVAPLQALQSAEAQGKPTSEAVTPAVSDLAETTNTTTATTSGHVAAAAAAGKEKTLKTAVTPTRLPSPSGSSCSASEGITLSGPQSATPPLQSETTSGNFTATSNTNSNTNNNTTATASGTGLVPASGGVHEAASEAEPSHTNAAAVMLQSVNEPFTETERGRAAQVTTPAITTTPTTTATANKSTPINAPAREPFASETHTTTSAPAPPIRRASYREIPRFYFPRGKSTSRSRIVTGPLHKRLSNPHLVVPSGVSMMPAMYDGQEGVHSPMDANFGAERVPQQRPATALSALRCLDDRNVQHYVEKEFARHPTIGAAACAAAKLSQRVHLLSSGGTNRSGGGSSSNNSGSNIKLRGSGSGKKEGGTGSSAWQHLVQCMQRLCTQCFGLPKYFAYLLIQLLQHDLLAAAGKTSGEDTSLVSNNTTSPSPAGNVNGTPPPPTTTTTNNNAAAVPAITAQQVYEFYETHLRTKETLRRSFDVLQLSAQLKAGGSSGLQPIQVETPMRNYLRAEDFQAYLSVLLDHHPGLAFLKQTPDFQQKYVETVVYRIFYEVDRFDAGRISFAEFTTSRLMDAFRQVDANEDINAVLLFFSYEHFYVLYCRFWEIDTDRDMLLTQDDLAQYLPEDLMNPLVTERVFAGAGRASRCGVPGRMGYEDFVYFCLAEEDKSAPRAIRYWFRVLDLDADGVLSVFEMRRFYDATVAKLERYLQDCQITFNDVIYQIFDMMRVPQFRGLTLSDLLREPEAAEVALNMLTNVVKFIQGEQRDPFVSHQERLLGGPEQTTWDRFARREYDRMAQEADE